MSLRKYLSFFALFTSLSTLLCCALPALLVSLGLGAVMAGLSANIPGLIWISEHKLGVFIASGFLLICNGILLWRTRNAPCPIEPALRQACLKGRHISKYIYFFTVVIFLIGFFFAYLAPMFF